MKYTMVRLFLIAASSCVGWASSNTADAGWGLLHGGGGSSGGYGSYGAGYGSSGGGYGSSGGFAASYGSSGAGYGSSGGAGYGSSGGTVASYGSSGGYAAPAYGSSGGSSGGGPGPLRRMAAHLHDHMAAKHARRAAYGSSGGSSGYAASYGSSGGSSGGYTSSYGSSGGYGSSGYSTSYGSSGGGYGSSGYSTSYGSSGGGYGSSGYSTSYGSTGSTYSSGYIGVSNQSPAAAADLASDDADAIYLNVSVPATAKVYVNDMPTTSTGVSRQYVSRGLESGKNYKFELRAEVVGADGKVVKETKLVSLAAGQKDTVHFASLENTRVQTVVTLNVPADAKVILAGNDTSAVGETRTFRTSQLKAGERWDDYVVEVQHNGKTKRESLRLLAGDDVALTFNFDDDKSLVASR